jgi:acetyltransferase-like isoleucine patch superfamily enzyme
MEGGYGKYCVIFDDAEVGAGTRIGNFVLVRDKTKIGKDCTIGSYVDIEGALALATLFPCKAAVASPGDRKLSLAHPRKTPYWMWNTQAAPE